MEYNKYIKVMKQMDISINIAKDVWTRFDIKAATICN